MHLTTLFIRDKFPIQYPKMLAKSVEPFGVDVHCHTDRPFDLPGNPNLWFHLLNRELIPEAIASHSQGWWTKLCFLNREFCPDEDLFWFCDVDTLFRKDPRPIFDHHGDGHRGSPAFVFARAYYPAPDRFNSALFCIDRRIPAAQFLWELLLHDYLDRGIPLSRQRWFGDQDWLEEHILKCRFPYDFYPHETLVSFIHWFHHRPQALLYEKHRPPIGLETVVGFTFIGRNKPHIVLKENLPGKEYMLRTWPWLEELFP